MDPNRRKELLEQFNNRMPEMGIISFRFPAANETFLGPSTDTKADFNSNRFKLGANAHPNKRMQELWDQYGESGFEFSVIKVLQYEDPKANHSKELEKMLEDCLAADPQAVRIRK